MRRETRGRPVSNELPLSQVARFKLPERLEVVDSFPFTAMGKVSKKELRDRIVQKLAGTALPG